MRRTNWLGLVALFALATLAGACADDEPGAPELLVLDVERAGDHYVLDFGAVAIGGDGEAGKTLELQLRNLGDAPLRIAPIELAPPFTSDVPASGLRVAPNAAARITFHFRPTAPGEVVATPSLVHDDGAVKLLLSGEGVAPNFRCADEIVDFGVVEQGGLVQREIVCTNHGRFSVQVGVKDGIVGEDKDLFSYGAIPLSGKLVAVGESITIPLTLNALDVGERSANFTLTAGDEELATVELEATVIASAIAVSPSCGEGGLAFGYVPPGAAREMALTIRNHGAQPLVIDELDIAGADAAAFAVKTAAPITISVDDPATPEAENEAQVMIEFSPDAEALTGARSAQLQITNSSNKPVFEACLVGNVGGPRIACTPGSLDFGPVASGVPSTREYLCSNDGIDDPLEPRLDNLFVETVSADRPEFTAAIRNADGTVGAKRDGYAVGETFTVAVTYMPVDTGVDQAAIEIVSNDPRTPMHRTTVVGHGRDLPACDFTIIPSNLRWGIVAPGESATLELAVQNNLDTECLITNVRVENDEYGVYSVDSPAFLTLPGINSEPGSGQIRFAVTFAPPEQLPGDVNVFTGSVRFDISNPITPYQEVPLRGASQEPCIRIDPGHVDFGTVAPGCSTIERTFTITSVCDDPIDVHAIELNLGASDEFGIRVRPVFPIGPNFGHSTRFTVVYVPQDVGEDIGSVFVHVDHNLDGTADDEEPYVATMSGRGANDALRTDRFEQGDRPKLDVLWVIDNSTAMQPFEQAVAANLASFVDMATSQQIDFQLGVTTTGVTDTGSSSCPGGVDGYENGRLFPVVGSTPRILTPTTSGLAAAWANNVNVGAC